MGYLRYSADALAPDSPLAAYRFSCLGDAYGTASLAVSFNRARELARSHSWRLAGNLRYQHAADIRADLQRLKRDTDTGRAAALTSAATPIVVPEFGPTPVGGVTRAGGTSRPLTTSVTPATGTAPAIALEPTPRKPMWLLAVAAFAVIILAVLGWWFFRARGTHPRATVGHKSVAVLYFANLSQDKSLDWLELLYGGDDLLVTSGEGCRLCHSQFGAG